MNTPTTKENSAPAHDPQAFQSAVAGILARDLAAGWSEEERAARYVLIDGALCPEGWIDAWSHEHGLDAEPLFLRLPEAASHEKGPHWIEIPRTALGEKHPLIRSLAEGPGLWQALTVATSDVPIMKLHAHLRGFMNGILEDKTSLLLRWYDARAGIPMLNLLPDAARAAFMKPFACWKSWDWHYRPIELTGPSQGVPDYPLPVAIDEALLKALGNVNATQYLIAQLEEENPVTEVAPLPMHPVLKHYVVERELGRAEALGLAQNYRDQLPLVWFALHIHPDVWQHAHMCEEARRQLARESGMSWLYDERSLRPQGEQALARLAEAFLEEMENARASALSQTKR